jgi:DNA-binding response OmpR family regulator
MQKPFSFAELRARCRALQRRRSPGLVLHYGDLEMNRVERSVTRSGEPVTLTNREFALLECLMLRRGTAISRGTLLEEVWNMSPAAGTNIVDVYVNYLRRKLHDGSWQRTKDVQGAVTAVAESQIIQTIRGVGYMIGTQS